MADKKPKADKNDTPATPQRQGAALHVWLDPVLMKALEKFLKSLKHASTKTAITEAALKSYLQEEGFWPPTADGD